jgi:hypothetical protein
VVIIKAPSVYTATFSGITQTSSTSGGFTTYTCTAGTGTVTFS